MSNTVAVCWPQTLHRLNLTKDGMAAFVKIINKRQERTPFVASALQAHDGNEFGHFAFVPRTMTSAHLITHMRSDSFWLRCAA